MFPPSSFHSHFYYIPPLPSPSPLPIFLQAKIAADKAAAALEGEGIEHKEEEEKKEEVDEEESDDEDKEQGGEGGGNRVDYWTLAGREEVN